MGRSSSGRGGTRAARASATARSLPAKGRAASGRSRRRRSRRRIFGRFAYAAALAFGSAAGFLRLSGGAHFFSDVAFSGVFTFIIIWLVHGLIYRWPATRLTDEQVEHAIERLVLPIYEPIERWFSRLRGRRAGP